MPRRRDPVNHFKANSSVPYIVGCLTVATLWCWSGYEARTCCHGSGRRGPAYGFLEPEMTRHDSCSFGVSRVLIPFRRYPFAVLCCPCPPSGVQQTDKKRGVAGRAYRAVSAGALQPGIGRIDAAGVFLRSPYRGMSPTTAVMIRVWCLRVLGLAWPPSHEFIPKVEVGTGALLCFRLKEQSQFPARFGVTDGLRG